MDRDATSQLIRGLRRWDLVALVINSVIGAGIFGLPSRVFALAGTYSLLSYIVSAVAVSLVILCFAEVGSRFRATGGPYLYTRATFGPVIGFQVGWLLWLGRIAASASLCNLFVGYLGYFVSDASLAPWRPVIIATIVVALAVANVVGVRVSTSVTNALTVGKLVPLFLLAIVGAFFVEPQRYSMAPAFSYSAISQAALLLVFTYMGFEGATIPTGEMRDPGRHLPFALLTGMAAITSVYIAVQIVCIGTLPDLASSERPLSDAGLRVLGAPGATLIAIGALVSMSGTLNALMFATPRLLFAMAENRQLPAVFAVTHPRFRTPIWAISLTAAITLGLALFSTFVSALTISAVVRLMAYTIVSAALPVLRRNRELPKPTFVVPSGPVIAVAAALLCSWLLSNSPWSELRVAGMAVVAGFVLFGLFALAAPKGRVTAPVEEH